MKYTKPTVASYSNGESSNPGVSTRGGCWIYYACGGRHTCNPFSCYGAYSK